jgi:transposase
MYYIGLDIHKKTISYCVKDASGQIHREGKIGSTRCELDSWIKTLPQPRMIAMEATIFTGWIYDHLLPHAEKVKVANPLMLRAIAAAKRKNDRIDSNKIADCLRCDFLPECYMASTAIRDRRRTLRYRNLVLKQMTQMKNRISGLLMETGVSYNKQRLHKLGYFMELMSCNEEVNESIRPLLKLSRETVVRSQRLDYALVHSLERDPLLAERLKRLRTIPALGQSLRSPGLLRSVMSHASSRSSRPSAIVGSVARREAPRTSWFDCPSPNKGTSTFSKFSWRLRNWLLDTAMNWLSSMSESDNEETRIGRRSP